MDRAGPGRPHPHPRLHRPGPPIYAEQFVRRVFDATDKLVDFPRIGREVPAASDVPEEVRELIHQGYRIVYWIVVDRIQILAIIHGTRDFENIERTPWDVDS